LTLALACSAAAQDHAPTPASWTEARELLAEGTFLESGLGDQAGANALYERGLEMEDLEPELEAELLFRLAEGRERMGDRDSAAELLQTLLEQHARVEPWSSLAHIRRLRLDEHARRILDLPIHMGFGNGMEAWLHAGGGTGRRDGLQWTDEIGREEPGALVWNSRVVTQTRDDIYLCFSNPSPELATVELWVRSVDFPAHLILFLVEEGGTRFASGHYVVEPAAGWLRIGSDLDDFFLFPGEDVTRHPDERRIQYLILEDATATYSTDRGTNRLLIDDVRLE